MQKAVKISFIIAGIVVLSVISYYLFFKKDSKIYLLKGADEHEDFVKDEEQQPESSTPPPSVPSGSVGSSNNPFDSSADLKKFQLWVINFKKDPGILGSDGADGRWGPKSRNAVSKYGDEYNKSTNVFDSLLKNLGHSSGVTRPDGTVRVVFGEKNYVARFYDNKRLIIWKLSNNSKVLSGYWYDGGLRLKSTSGRNKGKTFQTIYAWENLKDIVNFGDLLQSRPTYDNSWYKLQANSIYNNMAGITTTAEKNKVISALKLLKTNRDWYNLYEAFGKKQNQDIRKWLNSELSHGERHSINQNWKAKGMTTKLYSSFN